MKKFLKEFKEFTLRGNVMDLAVGVIIGAAFQEIVKSLTNDIISPLIGLFANLDFRELTLRIFDVELRYGAFLTAVINFVIMAFIIFLLVKGINRLSRLGKQEPEQASEPVVKVCPFCKNDIAADAVRCPYCTSELEYKTESEPEEI